MTALGGVEHLDVIEHLGACGVLGGIDPPPDPLAFEQAEEALHRGVCERRNLRIEDKTAVRKAIEIYGRIVRSSELN